jgi:hypothetical protein
MIFNKPSESILFPSKRLLSEGSFLKHMKIWRIDIKFTLQVIILLVPLSCLLIIQNSEARQNSGSVSDKPIGTLPVEITSFTYSIEGADVVLHWSVAQQINNYGFQIDRKGSDSVWQKVDFLFVGVTGDYAPANFSLKDTNSEPGTYYYRLKQIDFNGTEHYYGTLITVLISPSVQVVQDDNSIPIKLLLLQNYPNPFNPVTTIQFSSPIATQAVLRIYNLCGQEVALLFNGMIRGGEKNGILFDAANLPSGIYYACLQSNARQVVNKMVLLR